MIYQTIQGRDVPALGLGTWQLAGDTCREGVTHALDLGYRHIDTAQSYENEAEVGDALHASAVDRDDLFLTTKLWIGDRSPQDVRRAAEASLRRLRMDYVDLLLIHWPTQDMDLPGALDAMAALRDEGKVRHLGVSNFTPTLLRQALRHAPIFCNQVEYHPFLGQDRLRETAQRHDLLLTAYSPIAQGRVNDDPTLREIGEAHGKSAVQVTLRWLIQQDHVAAIPKASTPAHRAQNFEIFDFTLSEDEMDRIFDLARDERLIDPSWAPAWEK